MSIVSSFCVHILVVVQIIEELGSMDTSATDHAVVVDVDQLIGPHVINVVMNKPGMIKRYNYVNYVISYFIS